jgi:hypothetical protein
VSESPTVADFRSNVLELIRETFEQVEGFYLDKGTSFFETIEGVTAGTASQSASDRVATLAAQVDHLGYYMEVLMAHLEAGGDKPDIQVDWNLAWQRTAVTEEEWQGLIQRVHSEYDRFRRYVESNEQWNDETVGGVMGVIVHCAYHLGEIRQALGVIPAGA